MSTTNITQLLRRFVPRDVRNWAKAPFHTLKWLSDEAGYWLGANRTLFIRPNWPLRCHPCASRFARREQMDDLEQRKEMDAFIASVGPRTVLFDIGAHFGIFSFAALHHGGSTAQAIAVDASPFATRMIRVQAKLNRINDARLKVVLAMIGDKVGEGELVSVGVIAGGYFVPPSSSHSAADRSRTPMTTIDELVHKYDVIPTHLKIDVEGAEAAVLNGSIHTLSAHSPILFLELHHAMIEQAGGNPRLTLNLLEELKYTIFDTDGQRISVETLLSQSLVRVMASKTSIKDMKMQNVARD